MPADPEKKTRIKHRILPTILSVLPLPTGVFLTTTFEILCTNSNEFVFSAWNFLPFALLFWVLTVIAVFFALLFLPALPYRICRNLWLMLGVLFFVQGTYLNRGASALTENGTDVGGTASLVVNSVVWILFLGGAVGAAFIRDRKDISRTVCIILGVVLLATQAAGYISNSVKYGDVYSNKPRDIDKESNTVHKVLTEKNLTQLGEKGKQTVLYFCFDKFDEYFAECAYALSPQSFDGLEGFTWFRDHTALYGHTYPSVPYMITGHEYDADKTRAEDLNTTYNRGNDTVDVLHAHGYEIDLYTQRYYAYTLSSNMPAYVENADTLAAQKLVNGWKLAGHMTRMSLYRSFPLGLKFALGDLKADLCNRNIEYIGSSGKEEMKFQNAHVARRVDADPFTTTDRSVFKFLHVDGLHDYFAPEDKTTPYEKYRDAKGVAATTAECFGIVRRYIDALKAAGAYEDATIVVTGDHSTPVQHKQNIRDVNLTALFVKPSGRGEGSPLEISDAPVCHDDIWPTIMQSAGIDIASAHGESVFDVRSEYEAAVAAGETYDRVRRFIWQTYEYDNKMDVWTYDIVGSGRDFANWHQTSHTHYDHGIMR